MEHFDTYELIPRAYDEFQNPSAQVRGTVDQFHDLPKDRYNHSIKRKQYQLSDYKMNPAKNRKLQKPSVIYCQHCSNYVSERTFKYHKRLWLKKKTLSLAQRDKTISMRTHNDAKNVEQPIESYLKFSLKMKQIAMLSLQYNYWKILLCHQTLYSCQRVLTLRVYQVMKTLRLPCKLTFGGWFS